MNKIKAPALSPQDLFKKIGALDDAMFREVLLATNNEKYIRAAQQIDNAGQAGRWDREALQQFQRNLSNLSEEKCLGDDNEPLVLGVREFFNLFDVPNHTSDYEEVNISEIYNALTCKSIPIENAKIFTQRLDDEDPRLQISIEKNHCLSTLRELLFNEQKHQITQRISQLNNKLRGFDVSKQELIKKTKQALFADSTVHPLVYQSLLLAEASVVANVSFDRALVNTVVICFKNGQTPPPSIMVVPNCAVIVKVITETVF